MGGISVKLLKRSLIGKIDPQQGNHKFLNPDLSGGCPHWNGYQIAQGAVE